MEEASKHAREHRYGRQKPTKGRLVAVWELEALLIEHAKLYESEAIQDKRDAVAASLLAVCDYLQVIGINIAALRPILRPIEALVEREKNSIDPLFSERIRASRPKTPLNKLQQDGAIAALANYWIEHHRDKTRTIREQLSEIARRLDGNGLGKMDSARVKQARELVSQGESGHPARPMAETVTAWLNRAGADYGPQNALGIILPFLREFNLLWPE